MRRLGRYLEGRKLAAFGLVLVATGNAACQTGGWLLVRNAIDKGISAGDEHHLTVIVLIYLGVAAVGWVLQGWLIRGLEKLHLAWDVKVPDAAQLQRRRLQPRTAPSRDSLEPGPR